MPSSGSNPKSASAAIIAERDSRAINESNDTSQIEALQKQVQELQHSARYRSVFLSRLAHELRTPLTSILGFSEILLSQEKLTEAQRGFCERIQSSAHQLQASLNQLSDLARLESGQAKLAQEKISTAETLRDVLPALARSAEKKRLRLRHKVAADLPVIVSDRSRLRLVIYNLLAHAISRSPEGAVVNADVKRTTEGVAISVTDLGDPLAEPSRIGILDADDNSNTGELGLSIARQNVEILGGTISARNGDGQVEVTVILPAKSV